MRPRERAVAQVTAGVAAAAALYVWVLEPVLGGALSTRRDLAVRRAELARMEVLVRERKEWDRDWAEVSARHATRQGTDARQAVVMGQVERRARGAGMTAVASLIPQGGEESGGDEKLLLQAVLRGRLPAVSRFLYALSAGEPPLAVERIRIGADAEDPSLLHVEATVSSFWVVRK